MNKAFTRETDSDDDDDGPSLPALPQGSRNYMTPQGYARLRAKFMQLLDIECPKIVEIVSWAAKNGDRSENGDDLYGKKRLREIDRRLRFLTRCRARRFAPRAPSGGAFQEPLLSSTLLRRPWKAWSVMSIGLRLQA